MKSSSALFLQMVMVLIGLGAAAILLWEPHLEGRNVHATMFEIYCKDPFLAYVYVGSIPLFAALYRAFGLFGQLTQTRTFSPMMANSLRAIKRCAMAIIGFVAVGVVFILMFGDKDDRPAGLFMSVLVASAAIVIATAATMAERTLQNILKWTETSHD